MPRRTLFMVLAGLAMGVPAAGVAWSAWGPPPTSATHATPVDSATSPPAGEPVAAPLGSASALDDRDREVIEALAKITERGLWERDDVARVRGLLEGRKATDARALLERAGIGRRSSLRLAMTMTAPAERYDSQMGARTLLVLRFLRLGAADWELTDETRENMRLPFHPRAAWSFATLAPKDGVAGVYERCESIGRHRFASATFTDALSCSFRFRQHRFRVTTATEVLRNDASFADRLDHALSVLPPEHLALVKDIVIDPGDHPRNSYAAQTSSDGTLVNLYLSGAGAKVPQATLDETTVHELGHVVSLHQDGAFWERWDAAIARDGVGVSMYGLTNRYEDFAETYVLYLGSGPLRSVVGARHPARFAEMAALFDVTRSGVTCL